MTLTQQLEDKKKGCGIIVNVDNSDKGFGGWQCGQYYDSFKRIYYCKHCNEIIAILEQAIAEMQKQRQNFIDIINSLGEIRGKSNDLQCIKFGESFSTNSVEWLKKELLKQLNQPKTENDN